MECTLACPTHFYGYAVQALSTSNAVLVHAGGNNFVHMANPNHLETILRAEGKYPQRENNVTPNMAWILNKLKYPGSLPFE